jgi:EAL domain-containing protein (putative c-di-GMP-specific phosphodiesterase class I)
VEALVRWRHPQQGLVSPAQFIPLAEDTGLILPIGRMVLDSACALLKQWQSLSYAQHLEIAVNVSARQFRQADFVEQVFDALDGAGARPNKLKLELTESLLVENVEDIIDKMMRLKARGVCFSLDDFGTGYSSLAYLKRLPLDQLKIDQSFVRDVLTDPNDAAIVRTIIALGQSLSLEVIAEGVETEGLRDFLQMQGCHAYQGYFFSKPMMPSELDAYLQAAMQQA